MISGGFLFFAFGALLAESRMKALDERCEMMGLAKADGQRLGFTSGGFPNIKPDPAAVTWGVMWLVPADKMKELDRWAEARGLQRGVVSVVSPAGPRVPSTAYFNRGGADGSPNKNELESMIAAAEQLRMGKAYQTELAEWIRKL